MTEATGPRAISIGGNASGQLSTGDHNTQIARSGGEVDALRAFVALMTRELPDIGLADEEEAGARAALGDIDALAATGQPDPNRLRNAFGRFTGFVAQAGQPALTAAFMALAFHWGVTPPN